MRTAADRNIQAETRAVEEGHQAIVQDGGWVKVISDTHHDKSYRVEFHGVAVGEGVVFECKPEVGRKLFEDDHLQVSAPAGIAPCKHAALAARRLEREGLASFSEDGRWVATAKGVPERVSRVPDDPFEGLV